MLTARHPFKPGIWNVQSISGSIYVAEWRWRVVGFDYCLEVFSVWEFRHILI